MWSHAQGLHESVVRLYGVTSEKDLPDHGCWENLSKALKPYNIIPEDIPSPFNMFQNMEIDSDTGEMTLAPIRPKPGSYVLLKAEIDCLVAISACPEAGMGKEIAVQIYK
mgnify:CR=1 FL=1